MLPKDIFEAYFLLWSHCPKRVSIEIGNTFNWKTTHYSSLKQLLNPLLSPFYLYGGNFLPPQLTAKAFGLEISLKFSVNRIELCAKIYSNRTSRQSLHWLLHPWPQINFAAFTKISIRLEFHDFIVTKHDMVCYFCKKVIKLPIRTPCINLFLIQIHKSSRYYSAVYHFNHPEC